MDTEYTELKTKLIKLLFEAKSTDPIKLNKYVLSLQTIIDEIKK